MSSLGVWMNGERVGTWTADRGGHRFSYEPSWLRSPRVRALSLSLPITATGEIRGQAAANFFDNLLPDSDQIRERVARKYRTRSTEAFALLEAIGRDCVGAVQLLPEDMEPQGWDRIEAESLNESQVAAILRGVPGGAVLGWAGEDDGFRISLAGAQEKTALLFQNGQWCLPRGATPTTHIFKLPLGLVGGARQIDLTDSVENEWLCALILYYLGLPVARTELWRFEDQKALVVTRFDRSRRPHADGSEWIARLPQEDFCQALGLPARQKYEGDGGPGMSDCLRLLAGSSDPRDGEFFVITQLCYWLMGATDGHAKNYSIFLEAGSSFITTPLYDVISVFPVIGDGPNQIRWRSAKLAMAVRSTNAHYHLYSIKARHWRGLAMQAGGTAAWERMLRLVERVETTLLEVERVLPSDFPAKTWEAISRGIRNQVKAFAAGENA